MKYFLLVSLICFSIDISAQTIENVTFSSAASNNDSFQPVVGGPYGANLSGAGGSLVVSASYGESTYDQGTLNKEELSILTNIRVYPNPTTSLINVDLSQLSPSEYQLCLVDLNGKVVYHQITGDKSIEVDMHNYPTGSYVLKVQTKGTQQIDTFQIIKTK